LDLEEETTRATARTSTEPDDDPSAEGFGITLSPLTADTARQLHLPPNTEGVIVSDVEQGSSAFRAGISRGDVILQVNRRSVRTPQEASRALAQVPANGTAFLLISRGGQETFVTVRKE
jgi:serine protease Do